MVSDYRIEYDGDLWRVVIDDEFLDCFTMIEEAAQAVIDHANESDRPASGLNALFVAVDSELSAIAHGRPPSDSKTLDDMAYRFRKLYDERVRRLAR